MAVYSRWKRAHSKGKIFLNFYPIQSKSGRPLYTSLPRQKGKIKNNSLRIYALKVEANCFVIRGGAIKMGQKMQDHPDTQKELDKLKAAQNYLKEKGVFDTDSFHEFIFE